jgi:hypothetical protein
MEPHIPDTRNLSQTIPMTKPPPSFLLGHTTTQFPAPLYTLTTSSRPPPPYLPLSPFYQIKKKKNKKKAFSFWGPRRVPLKSATWLPCQWGSGVDHRREGERAAHGRCWIQENHVITCALSSLCSVWSLSHKWSSSKVYLLSFI